MREIKFRAWTGKEMLFKTLDDKNWYDSPKTTAKLMCASSTNDCRRFKVMQFTGLLDKNGKEIYEGDKLNIYVNGQLYSNEIVTWCDYKWYPFGPSIPVPYSGTKIEIIGNIYEEEVEDEH